MAAATHKGAISFGLVHIPVSLYKATSEAKISFNQLHEGCNSRIKQQKICAKCGDVVPNFEIVKGYEYEKDKYVLVTDADFENIKTEKDKTIQIQLFTELAEIRPLLYKQAYYALPDRR